MFFLFYILLNTIIMDLIGQIYPPSSGISLLIPGLDNAIPLVPEMVVFYVYVFGALLILTMLYFAFIEYTKGYALGWSMVFVEIIAAIIYIIFPVSVYAYHQYILSQPVAGNFWMSQLENVVAGYDSTFRCFPSLHAAGSTVCAYAWYRYSKMRPRHLTKAVAGLAIVSAACIILSTLFLKQHYVADEISGIAVGYVVGRITFNHLWKSPTPTGFLGIKK
jgi:membrane-associated phospholipid phosphatase